MIDIASAQAINHIEEQLMWSWTTLACLVIGWVSHMLFKIAQWQGLTGNKIPMRTYFSANWAVTALSLLTAVGLYIVLPELGSYFNLSWLAMTPLSALLVGYNSDSVADLAGKRIKALTVTPETPGG